MKGRCCCCCHPAAPKNRDGFRENLISIIIIRNYVRVRSTAGTQLVICVFRRRPIGERGVVLPQCRKTTLRILGIPLARCRFSERANVTTEAGCNDLHPSSPITPYAITVHYEYDTNIAETTTTTTTTGPGSTTSADQDQAKKIIMKQCVQKTTENERRNKGCYYTLHHDDGDDDEDGRRRPVPGFSRNRSTANSRAWLNGDGMDGGRMGSQRKHLPWRMMLVLVVMAVDGGWKEEKENNKTTSRIVCGLWMTVIMGGMREVGD